MSKATRVVSRLLVYSGLAAMCARVSRKSQTPRLTILTYHRIGESGAEGPFTDPQMISASPAGFEWQLGYLRRHFTMLPLEAVIEGFLAGAPLPANCAAITFDDGYQDNYSLAYPILRRYELPATIFLTTGAIDSTNRPTGAATIAMWWHELVYLLATTTRSTVSVSGLGILKLGHPKDRSRAREKLRRHLKALDEADRCAQVEALMLDLAPELDRPARVPARLTWDEVRKMSRNGISFEAHTHTHPILTRVSRVAAEREILLSKQIIENELGTPVRLFAYPNGKREDYDASIQEVLIRSGFEAAVTLIHGSNSLIKDRIDLYALRRIHVSSDDPSTFIAKVSGALEMFASVVPDVRRQGY